ncbi:MAG: bifunctional glutamate N-acetyltransferase/amino-acid acetyltransferase ArgJ [Brevinemataceae bacterium]
MVDLSHLEEGIISPIGFRATGVSCGLKTGGFKDMSLILSQKPCTTAMAFTSNKINGAHITIDKERFHNSIKAVIINSGNANCLTGQEGMNNAREMVEMVEKNLELHPGECLIASTGTIGQQLNMIRVKYGIDRISSIIKNENNIRHFCSGIMTSDTRQKNIAYEFDLEGTKIRIGVSAKGASMMNPWLESMQGTLLTFITTDIAISKELLSLSLSKAITTSFNRISIDNDTSPNDSIFILANGMAENPIINDEKDPRFHIFSEVLNKILLEMSKLLLKQGLGVTKLVHLEIKEATSLEQAEKLVRNIAYSYQVKTALFGQVPVWQKIINILGYSDIDFDINNVSITLNGLTLFTNGKINSSNTTTTYTEIFTTEYSIVITLGMGEASTDLWTCDLSHDYVKVNSHFLE